MGRGKGRDGIKQSSWAVQLAGDDQVWLCLSFPSGLRQKGPRAARGPTLSSPSGPTSALEEESAGYHDVALKCKENHQPDQRPYKDWSDPQPCPQPGSELMLCPSCCVS